LAKTSESRALVVALESESLEALYAAWLDVRLQNAQAASALAKAHELLDTRAAYLLKTVEAARSLPAEPGARKPKTKAKSTKKKSKALVEEDPLAKFHEQARDELERARKELTTRQKQQEKDAAATEARVRKALLARADQHLALHKPSVKLTAHPVGKDHVLLQLGPIGEEDAVLLLRLLSEKLPTRWGFYGDDAIEDLQRGQAQLYRDEGVTEPWPADAESFDAAAFARGDFVPFRGNLAFALAGAGFPRFRFVQRGPVGQVEARRKGEPYEHLLRREDAELLSGYLLRLKLAGKIELQLDVG